MKPILALLLCSVFVAPTAARAEAFAQTLIKNWMPPPALNLISPGVTRDAPTDISQCVGKPTTPIQPREVLLGGIDEQIKKWKDARDRFVKVMPCHRYFRYDSVSNNNDTRPRSQNVQEFEAYAKRLDDLNAQVKGDLARTTQQAQTALDPSHMQEINSCTSFKTNMENTRAVAKQMDYLGSSIFDAEAQISFPEEAKQSRSSLYGAMTNRKAENAIDYLIDRHYQVKLLPKTCEDSYRNELKNVLEQTKAVAGAFRALRTGYAMPLTQQLNSMFDVTECRYALGSCDYK